MSSFKQYGVKLAYEQLEKRGDKLLPFQNSLIGLVLKQFFIVNQRLVVPLMTPS